MVKARKCFGRSGVRHAVHGALHGIRGNVGAIGLTEQRKGLHAFACCSSDVLDGHRASRLYHESPPGPIMAANFDCGYFRDGDGQLGLERPKANIRHKSGTRENDGVESPRLLK